MEINKKQIELITLVPSENHFLTRKDRKDNEEVILSKQVILGRTDSPDNWMEITELEGDEMLAKFNAEQEKRMNNATR